MTLVGSDCHLDQHECNDSMALETHMASGKGPDSDHPHGLQWQQDPQTSVRILDEAEPQIQTSTWSEVWAQTPDINREFNHNMSYGYQHRLPQMHQSDRSSPWWQPRQRHGHSLGCHFGIIVTDCPAPEVPGRLVHEF